MGEYFTEEKCTNKRCDYQKVVDYVTSHLEDYKEIETQYLIQNYGMFEYNKFVPDVLRQIYDEIGLLSDEDNLYLGFIKILEENFDIDSNIIEVGGGVIPSLAKHIHLKQKKGSITVYDPRLSHSIKDEPGFKLKREKFTDKTKINKANIIIGLMPCEATELIIRKAAKQKINFLIGLCEGGHQAYDDYFDDYLFEKQMKSLATREIEKNNLGELGIASLKSYSDPYPVIYNKKVK